MRHVIYRAILSSEPIVDISESEYTDIARARDGLVEIISAEEKYDALMENYVELEETLLSLATRHLAFYTYDHTYHVSLRTLVSRRVLNLLSSARLYRDAYPQTLNRTLESSEAEIGRLRAILFDATAQPMAFRIIEAVRNYAQHQELPISAIGLAHTRVEARLAHSVTPYIDAIKVAHRRDIKPDVRAALFALGDKVNPLGYLREYVEHIGGAHEEFRSVVKSLTAGWETAILQMIERYRAQHPENKDTVLAVGKLMDDDTIDESIPLIRESLDYRRYLQRKNRPRKNLSKCFVQW
jgi:hypothetical protein